MVAWFPNCRDPQTMERVQSVVVVLGILVMITSAAVGYHGHADLAFARGPTQCPQVAMKPIRGCFQNGTLHRRRTICPMFDKSCLKQEKMNRSTTTTTTASTAAMAIVSPPSTTETTIGTTTAKPEDSESERTPEPITEVQAEAQATSVTETTTSTPEVSELTPEPVTELATPQPATVLTTPESVTVVHDEAEAAIAPETTTTTTSAPELTTSAPELTTSAPELTTTTDLPDEAVLPAVTTTTDLPDEAVLPAVRTFPSPYTPLMSFKIHVLRSNVTHQRMDADISDVRDKIEDAADAQRHDVRSMHRLVDNLKVKTDHDRSDLDNNIDAITQELRVVEDDVVTLKTTVDNNSDDISLAKSTASDAVEKATEVSLKVDRVERDTLFARNDGELRLDGLEARLHNLEDKFFDQESLSAEENQLKAKVMAKAVTQTETEIGQFYCPLTDYDCTEYIQHDETICYMPSDECRTCYDTSEPCHGYPCTTPPTCTWSEEVKTDCRYFKCSPRVIHTGAIVGGALAALFGVISALLIFFRKKLCQRIGYTGRFSGAGNVVGASQGTNENSQPRGIPDASGRLHNERPIYSPTTTPSSTSTEMSCFGIGRGNRYSLLDDANVAGSLQEPPLRMEHDTNMPGPSSL